MHTLVLSRDIVCYRAWIFIQFKSIQFDLPKLTNCLYACVSVCDCQTRERERECSQFLKVVFIHSYLNANANPRSSLHSISTNISHGSALVINVTISD